MGEIKGSIFVCKSKALSIFLQLRNIKIVGVSPNRDGSGRMVFLFEITDPKIIENLIEEYKQAKNNNR